MSTLDRNRPFAQYFPPHEGATYSQDGRRYDDRGRLLSTSPAEPKKPAAAAKAAAAKAPTSPAEPKKPADPDQAQLDAQMG